MKRITKADIERIKAENEPTGSKSFCNDGLADAKAEMGRLRYALERLGSMEAFTMSRAVDKKLDAELMARIDYARRVLAG